MRFGINTFLFTCPFTNHSTEWFPQFKAWGFDTVEISVEDLDHIDPAYIKDQLAEHGLACGSVTPCLGPDKDLRGTPEQQRAGIDFMKRVIDQMELLDAPTLCGVVYSTVGRADAVSPEDRKQQWQTVVRNLKEVSNYAGEHGRIIAMEAINRFETDFINTCEQGLEMIHDVDNPALMLHLDTFHMNIEQKDQAAAIRKAGKHLGHFHACGCDRGTPGSDHINWPSIATALREIGYDRDIVIESFTPDVKVIARAASIWRQIEPTREEIASKGVQFLRKLFT
jgi:D-psicose/D-tagatose/L-ribulose 3-epimerase